MTPEPNTDRARQAIAEGIGAAPDDEAVDIVLDSLSDAGLWVGGPWQPIDTAPGEGHVLAVDDKGNIRSWLMGVNQLPGRVTHWAPLPSPPEENER